MNVGIVFAGGTGQRMNNAAMPKQFLELYGKPIIIYTLEVFQNHPEIDEIIVPCVEGWEAYLQELANKYNISKLSKIIPGGKNTQESKLHALRSLKTICKSTDIVVMHDAVRPLISSELISNNIKCVKENGNAITADPFTETGVVSTDGKTVESTIERHKLYIAKAPQSFYFEQALWAHEEGENLPDTITIDTCTILNHFSHPLHFVACDSHNIKITTPGDYYVFKALYDFNESKNVLGV